MNRVILSGRLAGRPKLSYTPHGDAVAEFRLLVPRGGRTAVPDDAFDAVDCVAFRVAALELTNWGDLDYRVSVEGRLRRDLYLSPNGCRTDGVRVHCDDATFIDPVAVGLGTDPAQAPRVPLPTPIRSGGRGRV